MILYFCQKNKTRQFIMHVCNLADMHEFTHTMYTCSHLVQNVYLAYTKVYVF